MAERERARAKVNLLLRVFGRGPDGFHAVETLLLRLGLADEVEVAPLEGRAGIELTVEGEGADSVAGGPGAVPAGADNLCWVAAERFHEAAGLAPRVSIVLRKRVPAGAGLGGGSADAAAVLRALDALHGRPLSPGRLLELAGELGSDVPFALVDRPAALAWGRGTRLLPLPAPPPRPALLVVPAERISTEDAYGWLDEDRAGGRTASGSGEPPAAELLPEPSALADWAALGELAANDFEGPVFRRHPELRRLRDALAGEAAGPVLLCGSGSALASVYEDAGRRDAARERLDTRPEVRTIPTRIGV